MVELIHQFAATAQTTCFGGGNVCDTGLPTVAASSGQLQAILQIAFGVIGAVAVLFIVIGGIRFVFSDGNPQDAAQARNTIIYALVGLVIAISAEGIVTFALNRF